MVMSCGIAFDSSRATKNLLSTHKLMPTTSVGQSGFCSPAEVANDSDFHTLRSVFSSLLQHRSNGDSSLQLSHEHVGNGCAANWAHMEGKKNKRVCGLVAMTRIGSFHARQSNGTVCLSPKRGFVRSYAIRLGELNRVGVVIRGGESATKPNMV